MIRQNFGYKLLALIASIFLWFYVNNFQATSDIQNHKNSFSKVFTVPLRVRGISPDCVVTSMPKTVNVTVEGHAEDVNAMSGDENEISARVSLRGYSPGQYTVRVIARLAEPFAGVLRAKSDPVMVNVTLADKAYKEMKLDASFEGTPPEGYRFAPPVISPDRATVYGSKQSLNAVSALVMSVSPSKIGEKEITGDFPILAMDKNGKEIKGLEIVPRQAHLNMALLEVPSKKLAYVIPNVQGQPTIPLRVVGIDTQPRTVALVGRAASLENLDNVETEAIQLSGRKQTFTQQVKLLTPPGVDTPGVKTVAVTVRIAGSP